MRRRGWARWCATLALGAVILHGGAPAAAGESSAPRPEPTSPPAGAAEPGTDEWYSVELPSAHVAVLGVYRPAERASGASVLVIHGKDGPRRLYEELAHRYRDTGLTAIVACWFAYPEQQFDDAYGCPGVGEFEGATDEVVTDIDAIVGASQRLRGVRERRLGLVGQSYGARVSLLRAAMSGGSEPVVSSCGYLAEQPVTEVEVPRFPYPSDPDVAARITAPVLVAHGEADPITPLGQAERFAAEMEAAGHPVDLVTYGSPAGHSVPWDVVTAFDDPDRLLRDRFLDDTAKWLKEHLRAS
jgi:dienelactone hydrolase